MKLEEITHYGQPRRRDFVRVVKFTLKGEPMIRVLWKEGDRRRAQSFPQTRKGQVEAKAYAEAMSDKLAARTNEIHYEHFTVRQLFEKYIQAKCDEWRPRTLEIKKERWQKFELFVGKTTPSHLITRERLDDFKRVLLAKHSPNQVAHIIGNAISVFRFSVSRDLIAPTKLTDYEVRFGRDVQRSITMGEYSAEERQKLIASMNPKDSRQWRAWALTTIFAYNASRQRATRLIEWDDVTLTENGGSILWRKGNDKMANERVQPLSAPVAHALWVALGWRQRDGYTGRFVFYSPKDKKTSDEAYSFQAYAYQLHKAEERADIPKMKYRAAHGFRRGVSGDVFDATGSEHKAAEWIGDKSVKVVKRHYLLHRDERQQEISALVDEKMRPNATETENASVEEANEVVSVD